MVTITRGELNDVSSCVEALNNSEIGKRYFGTVDKMKSFIEEGISKNELWIAKDLQGSCLGYAWYTLNGTFYRLPYLRSIAVHPDHRRKGIASLLLDHFEEQGFKSATHVFLLVSDFNHEARKLYHDRGYKQVGAVEDLFVKGVTELIHVKSRLS